MSQTTITRVHAPNSLEHLSQRPVRPRSSGSLRTPLPTPGRPQSASSYYRGTKTMTRPASAAARMPTANRIPGLKPVTEMSKLQKAIYGQSGPPMSGVTTYPYSRAQKLYEEDFEQVVASSLTHPYMSITSFNVGSAPHNLITGMRRRVSPPCTRSTHYSSLVMYDRLPSSSAPHAFYILLVTTQPSSQCCLLYAGTAFSERRSTAFQTECARAYTPKSYNDSFNLKANGLRLEEFMRVG
eukprot:6212362-Pleurochrysis_carterae.AAC.9